MSYGWLFESPDDDISGDNHINLEHLPPELKQVAIQIGVASENGIYGHSRAASGTRTSGRRSWISTRPLSAAAVTIRNPTGKAGSRR